MNAALRNVLDSVRILETREVGHEAYEICATAQADYDEVTRVLHVNLDAFVRHVEMRGPDEVFRPAWLPRRDTVRTHTSIEDAPEASKEIFESWARKAQRTIPPLGEWKKDASWLAGN